MKKYNSPEIEILDSSDVVSTSGEVETGKIPISYASPNQGSFEF